MLPAANQTETPIDRCFRRRREHEEFERRQTEHYSMWHPRWMELHEDERESIRKAICENEFMRAYRSRRGDDDPLFVLCCLDKLKEIENG